MSADNIDYKALLGHEPSDATAKLIREAYIRPPDNGARHPAAGMEPLEFSYELADDIGKNWSGLLARWREGVLTRAIEARDARAPWTDRFASLGAEQDEIQAAAWRRVCGVLRLCLVRKLPETDNINHTTYSRQPESVNGSFPELLPHMVESLRNEVKFFGFVSQSSADNTAEEWSEGVIEFPQKISMHVISCSFLLEGDGVKSICAAIDSASHKHMDLLACLGDARRLLKECQQSMTSKQEKNGDVLFWLVLDKADSDQAVGEEFLTYAFRRLCGEGHERSLTERINPNGLLLDGVVGLEGVVLVRRMQDQVSGRLKPGNPDQLWGGSAWAAWIVTLFQRAATEKLANDTARLGTSLSGLDMNDDYVDDVCKQAGYWTKVIHLESKWMYKEIAGVTDVDRIYQSFQKAFDIDAMWDDVREQTELIARYAETERIKKVNTVQTLGGFIFGLLVLLSGFFGMNFYPDLGKYVPWNWNWPNLVILMVITFFVLTFASVYWWWRETSTHRFATLFRKLLFSKELKGNREAFVFIVSFVILCVYLILWVIW